MKKQPPFFQPVVEDSNGELRKQFASLHEKTKISKAALYTRVFELGLAQLAAAEKLVIPLSQ